MKEVLLSFQVRVRIERTDVNWLEATLLVERERCFREALLTVLHQIEGGMGEAPQEPCATCGGPWRGNGRKSRSLGTLLGPVTFTRTRLRCRDCGAERYPLDEALGLAPGMKHTLGVRERALWAATEVSYEKSERFLAKFTGLEVSRGTIHGLAREEGERLLTQDAATRVAVFTQGQPPPPPLRRPRLLFIQVDGTGVRNRATRSSMESKVGVVFSERARVAAHRIELVDKRCVVSLEPVEAFGESLWLEAVRQGVETAAQVVFVSDGAPWTQNVQRTHFPQALYVLDLWHLERACRDALGAEHPAIPALLALARAGQPEELRRCLHRLAGRAPTAEERTRRTGLVEYVALNAAGIRNLPQAAIWGSGAVEKQVDVLVCRRFKTRGMSWYRPGAAALQRLRVLKANGDWDAYWGERQQACARYAA
ncbi:MAG TPA: UPF0236 family protein [Candidatus Methylomirabilis sp.]|jgi:hypothetical protein|nr:UPF0236 family protein [Candidatus Methylomirabilis sp.]